MINALSEINIAEVPNLQSPTSRRAFDGARHSTITIYTKGSSFTHSFDDEFPNHVLVPLMAAIKNLNGTEIEK
jgi:hypothetical protein